MGDVCAGPEIWRQTHGRVTHFVSSMGTTGTIMGVSRYLKERNPDVTIVGLQPEQGASIAGALAADDAAFTNACTKVSIPMFSSSCCPHKHSLTRLLFGCWIGHRIRALPNAAHMYATGMLLRLELFNPVLFL